MLCPGCLKDIEHWRKPVRAVDGTPFHNNQCYMHWLIRRSFPEAKRVPLVKRMFRKRRILPT